MPSMTAVLAGVLTARRFGDLPASAVHAARRLMLDYIGVTVAGSASETGALAARFAFDQAGPAQARVLGSRRQISAVNAAFANAIAAHSLEFDDIDADSLFHSSAPVVSAALAVAEAEHASGAQLIRAVLAGCETLARVSRATSPQLLQRGFHGTAACGVFGGTAASSVLLNASPAEFVNAMGLAGAQASGLMEVYGASMAKRFNPGPAARNAVTSALLARAGFTAEQTVLDGRRGFGMAFAGSFRTESFLSGLGTDIPIPFEFKRYGCCRPIHCAIDSVLKLRDCDGIEADQVDSLTVYRHPMWESFFAIAHPRSAHEARVSLPYSLALALVYGTALPEQYAMVGQGDAEVMALSERIGIDVDLGLQRTASSRVVLTTLDGRTLTARADYPSGSARHPLSDQELEGKFHSLVDQMIGRKRAGRLVDLTWNLHELRDVTELTGELAHRELA